MRYNNSVEEISDFPYVITNLYLIISVSASRMIRTGSKLPMTKIWEKMHVYIM